MVGKDCVLLASESDDSTLRMGGRVELEDVEIMGEKLPGALVFEPGSPDMTVVCAMCAWRFQVAERPRG